MHNYLNYFYFSTTHNSDHDSDGTGGITASLAPLSLPSGDYPKNAALCLLQIQKWESFISLTESRYNLMDTIDVVSRDFQEQPSPDLFDRMLSLEASSHSNFDSRDSGESREIESEIDWK